MLSISCSDRLISLLGSRLICRNSFSNDSNRDRIEVLSHRYGTDELFPSYSKDSTTKNARVAVSSAPLDRGPTS